MDRTQVQKLSHRVFRVCEVPRGAFLVVLPAVRQIVLLTPLLTLLLAPEIARAVIPREVSPSAVAPSEPTSDQQTLQRPVILEHLSERHPGGDLSSEREFWNRSAGQDIVGLTQWIETESHPLRRNQLLQGLGWIDDARAQAWIRDHALQWKDSSMQLVTAIALGNTAPVLDSSQLEANLDTLEKLSQKTRSHGVKREVRGAVEGLLQAAVEKGLTIPSIHQQRAWWRRMPEPLPRSSELVARPKFGRELQDAGRQNAEHNILLEFPAGKWTGEWIWVDARQAVQRAEVVLENSKLKLTLRSSSLSEPRTVAQEFSTEWKRLPSAPLRMTLSPITKAATLGLPLVWQVWTPSGEGALTAEERKDGTTVSRKPVTLRAENAPGVGVFVDGQPAIRRSQ